jgi:hypothetical protein
MRAKHFTFYKAMMTVLGMRRAVSAASVLILLPWWHMMMMMVLLGAAAASASAEGGRPRTSDDLDDGVMATSSKAILDENAARARAPGDKGRPGSIVRRLEEWEGTIDDILDMSEETGVRQVWDGPPDENGEREDDVEGGRQRPPPAVSDDALRFWNKLRGDHAYYKHFVSNESHRHLHERCQNQEELCTVWALQQRATDDENDNDDNEENDDQDETTAIAECDRNFRYMKTHCPVACRSCLWLDVPSRCAPDPNATDALLAGDLDRLFERITTDPALVEQFQPQVLSRPAYSAEEEENSGGMWLVAFPTFLSEDEADRMARLAEQSGLQPSEGTLETDTGEAVTVTSDARTSWNAVREPKRWNDAFFWTCREYPPSSRYS